MDVQTPAVGDRLALTRLISEVENDANTNLKIIDECYRRSGRAHLIGVTGAPGTGKSSLVNRITQLIRSESQKTVAIVAVDPSSPFSGGAILGDRVRMRDLAGDEGVFIRSMASRGELGGLARATAAVVRVLDAAGFDLILIETVGAGQSEIEIARLAHTTIVVECPGMGDDIQAVKAGILEIADILAVNKADLPGAETTERILRANLELGYPQAVSAKAGHGGFQEADAQSSIEGWCPPVIKTVATEGTGVPEVIKAISQHRDYLKKTGLFQKRDGERLQVEFEQILSRAIMENWRNQFSKEKVDGALMEVLSHQRSPASAVKELLKS